jgi:peptidyl-prolyl cis-trans isomerase C
MPRPSNDKEFAVLMKQYRLPILIALFLGSALLAVGCGGGESKSFSGTVPDVPSGVNKAVADSLARMHIVLARVGDMPITVGDLRNHMIKSTGSKTVDRYMQSADIVQVALGSLVDQYVWADMALKRGIRLDADDERQIAALRSQLLATKYMNEVLLPEGAPSREAVEKYYNEHKDKYFTPVRVAVRHILVPTEAEARRVEKLAKEGKEFAALARQYSQDPRTKDLGGALGYVQRDVEVLGIGKDPKFYDTVLKLDPGGIGVVQLVDGWHVVKVEKKEGGKMQTLDEVYDQIVPVVNKEHWPDWYENQLVQARKEMGAKFLTDAFAKFTGVPNNCERIMDMAAKHPNPDGRIELYRRVAFDFPDCDSAPKAQFMIGYLFLTADKKPKMAERALTRLQTQFGRSEWRKAGDYLLQHLNDDPSQIGSPDEIMKLAKEGSR